jgi:hypothetical protein
LLIFTEQKLRLSCTCGSMGLVKNHIFTLQIRPDDTPDFTDNSDAYNCDYGYELNFVLPALQPIP